jgi:serine/threonine protein kinase
MLRQQHIPTTIGRRSDYEVIKALREARHGGYNVGIYIVKEHRKGTKYIEKRVGKEDIRKRQAEREVRAMLQLQKHKNIINIQAYDLNYSPSGYGCIFMQHCELGSLASLIKNFRARSVYALADEGFLWKVFYDMSIALCYLSTGRSIETTQRYAKAGRGVEALSDWNQIIHRDIKPDNIFLTWKTEPEGRYPTVVLGDFGLCTSTNDINLGLANPNMHSGCTPGFAPPEAPNCRVRGDVYQLALTIQCLANMSYGPPKGGSVLPRVYQCRYLKDLLLDCLRTSPDNRPMASNLPKLVYRGWTAWLKSHPNNGERLPRWVFG